MVSNVPVQSVASVALSRRSWASAAALLLAACGTRAPEPPARTATPVTLAAPAPMGGTVPAPSDNPFTEEGIALGRRLFYDPILSRTGQISCASCHQQEHAFSDPRPKSLGVDGQLGRRHSMPLFNLAWSTHFFWDGRAGSIEEQVLMPIQDPTEMDRDLDVLMSDLQGSETYPDLFDAAFPGEGITPTTLSRGLAQFVRSITSFDAPWDHLTHVSEIEDPAAKRGHAPFAEVMPVGDPNGIRDMCDRCHQASAGLVPSYDGHDSGLFLIDEFRGNGLPLTDDRGRAEVAGHEAEVGKFKVPSLRNVSVTAPYMHDGSMATLEDVLKHYNEQIRVNAGTDPVFLRDGQPVALHLDPADFPDMVVFLDMFTDRTLLTNPAWSDPFAQP